MLQRDIGGSHDADLDLQNNNGETAIMIAAAQGHYKCVEELAHLGADLSLKNNAQLTAIEIAGQNGEEDIVLFLTGFVKFEPL